MSKQCWALKDMYESQKPIKDEITKLYPRIRANTWIPIHTTCWMMTRRNRGKQMARLSSRAIVINCVYRHGEFQYGKDERLSLGG